MSGIAGISRGGQASLVKNMLEKMAYRGHGQPHIIERQNITLGVIRNSPETIKHPSMIPERAVWDGPRPPLPFEDQIRLARGAFSLASANHAGLLLARDALGIRPLYYSHTADGALCFASEVKAILDLTRKIHEFRPGYWLGADEIPHRFYDPAIAPPEDLPIASLAKRLNILLEQAVLRQIDGPVMGSWLSGGLDSSAIAALVRPHLDQLHTIAGGMDGAPDLEYARHVAEFLIADHHDVIVTRPGLLKV
ncbi:MAG: hypothetical protein FIB03_16580, partial [Anaerolineae bacterium]|nr:hypothetical protein [Anaerolineae bacterium]